MSQSTVNSEVSTQDPIISKINTYINEERIIKDYTSLQLSKIKQLDELIAEITASGKKELAHKVLKENLTEDSRSLVSRYVLGIEDPADEGSTYLRGLLEDFTKAAKWTIVDHIADRILEKDENNRQALRSKVESTERLRGKKELKPYLEKLATIDRKNPEVARKYAMSIMEEDQERALEFLKQAAETYARQKEYKHLDEIWNQIVAHDHKDLEFFNKMERILIGNREKTRMAGMLQTLVDPYKNGENWAEAIEILKKILEYEPNSSRARTDLVRCYKTLYAEHSLLNEFLKMSDLTNNKKSVGPCIGSFERNIVFDKDNYVFHRTRGVGKITAIDKDQVIVDFPDNPDQKMTIQMAISSLQPLGKDHIWVLAYESPETVKELFETDIPEFFKLLLKSFGNKMVLADIKNEISGKYVKAADWSKWWTKARGQLKKSDDFGFNPKKKDELILRETKISQSEDLIAKFQSTADWQKKLDCAVESLKDMDMEDALHYFSNQYREQESNKDVLKKIQSYLFVEMAAHLTGDDDIRHKISKDEIKEAILSAKPKELSEFSRNTENTELKRELANLIIKYREDYPEILLDVLFEIPIKVNRYVLNELNRKGHNDILKKFIQRSYAKYRDYPEVFLWVAKNSLTGQWAFDWLDENKEEVMLLLFRLLKPLALIEKKGTRLKNNALETIFGTTNITVDSIKEGPLTEILKNSDANVIRRMSALFKDVPYVPDAQKDNFMDYLQTMRPDYVAAEKMDETEKDEKDLHLFPDENVILVSTSGLAKRKAYLENLINVEMPANSKDIGEAQEKGDLRENAEYKAAMERQQQLQTEILKLDSELKKARIIDPSTVRSDIVTIGSRVRLSTPEGQDISYTILGPWDADTNNNIISYLSPLGMALIGKKSGDDAMLDTNKHFKIKGIEKGV